MPQQAAACHLESTYVDVELQLSQIVERMILKAPATARSYDSEMNSFTEDQQLPLLIGETKWPPHVGAQRCDLAIASCGESLGWSQGM